MIVEKLTRAGRLGAALLSDAILFRRKARHGFGSFSIIGHNVAFVVARPGWQVSKGVGYCSRACNAQSYRHAAPLAIWTRKSPASRNSQ